VAGRPFNVAVADLGGTYRGTASLPGLYFGGDGFSYGTVEVDYTYAAAPEPGTLCAGLTAISLCGIEFARRRRFFRLN
jgi:hypothetical protein